RQALHERLRQHAWAARAAVQRGERNDLLDRVAGDPEFKLAKAELETIVDPGALVGRAPRQVDAFLRRHVDPLLERHREALEGPAPGLRV
ncbi:MAG: adenylosuccinate lyase, partial [Gemmatimonadota bacterium]